MSQMTKTASRAVGPRSTAQKQDESIMGTNNSSIVSKRSVERLYYPHEPHFFRYFVKKPQRRSPLINRGYWLRMKAVDDAVHRFLKDDSSSKPKVVINLGAGYDPLPWQCLTRYPDHCKGVTFIDIDYKDLMFQKRATVVETPELHSMFTNIAPQVAETGVMFKSDQYVQIGCDLRQTAELSRILSSVIDVDSCLLMFTAEVSITYMTIEGADALLRWAGSLPSTRFCLLEQILPQGAEHPFAKTMLSHFRKLTTPLHSVEKFPTERIQESRFRSAGWSDVRARNLWELWASADFLSTSERQALDSIEPFDEWEEFAIYGCHYVLLEASNGDCCTDARLSETSESQALANNTPRGTSGSTTGEVRKPYNLPCTVSTIHTPQRRFGSCLPLQGENPREKLIGNYGGMGQTRLASMDVYGTGQTGSRAFPPSVTAPAPRMCHTTTTLNADESLLIGGRTSPEKAFSDCWIHHKWQNSWERVEDLPQPLYRHSALNLGSGMVLVMGGKTNATVINNKAYIWSRDQGWQQLHIGITLGVHVINSGTNAARDEPAPAVSGAYLLLNKPELTAQWKSVSGVLVGGMKIDGTISQQIYDWEIIKGQLNSEPPSIVLHRRRIAFHDQLEQSALRFGAAVTLNKSSYVLVGGIVADGLLPEHEEVSICERDTQSAGSDLVAEPGLTESERPMLIGVSVSQVLDDGFVIIGGGAVCFSFGTYWNKKAYTFGASRPPGGKIASYEYLETLSVPIPLPPSKIQPVQSPEDAAVPTTSVVSRTKLESAEDFHRITNRGQPVIFEELELGSCKEKWTDAYLNHQIGADREVTIHQCTSGQMDFVKKNFIYVKKPFGLFLEAINAGETSYLRSLSAKKPLDEPTDIAQDFPAIAGDFKLPLALRFVSENAHSSPLRISGPVNMWLHYDVMANVLCQIRGSKRLLLFPPADITHLGFAPGQSSSSIDAFSMLEQGTLRGVHPREVTLSPGDVLFIPPLWLHMAKPMEGVSISVNVFYRNLQKGYAIGRDVYGNRDLEAYEKGRLEVTKISKAFKDIPSDMRRFYMLRLADELQQMACS